MKKTILLTLVLVIALAFAGCAKSDMPQNTTGLANPWQSFDSLPDAEAEAGFPLDLPVVIGGTYKATEFRVKTGEPPLLEVIYQDEDFEVDVRKAQGEGQEISGVYGFQLSDTAVRNGMNINIYRPVGESETPNAVLITFDFGGYSWSFYASKGYWGDSCEDFLNAVLPLPVSEEECRNESAKAEFPALIMVNGALYYDCADLSTVEARCGMLDGTIDSMCNGNIPMQDNQSNFGTGYGYQIGADRIEVLIDGNWHVFLPFNKTDTQWSHLFGDSYKDFAEYQAFLGLHTSGYDGSTILVEEAPDGKLQLEISLFRLCTLENLNGAFEFDMVHFGGLDPCGDEIKGVLYYNAENSLCLEIQESQWEYLPVGTVFTGFDD